LYTEALTLDQHNNKLNSIIYNNRALAYLKNKDLDAAMKDCNSSIELNPNYSKPYLKRAEIKL